MQLLKIDKEKIFKDIFEYIDSHDDKKEFNKILKSIFEQEKTIQLLSFKFTMAAILKFETEFQKSTKTFGRIISDMINAVDISTGEKIYDYTFYALPSDNGQKLSIQLDVTRKDKQKNHYAYLLVDILEKFSESLEKPEELLCEMLKNIIDLAYEYAEIYIERIRNENLNFDEKRFLKEITYIICDTGANEIYSQLENGIS